MGPHTDRRTRRSNNPNQKRTKNCTSTTRKKCFAMQLFRRTKRQCSANSDVPPPSSESQNDKKNCSLFCLRSFSALPLSLDTRPSLYLSSPAAFFPACASLTLLMKKLTAIHPFDRSGPAGRRLRQNSSSAPSTCVTNNVTMRCPDPGGGCVRSGKKMQMSPKLSRFGNYACDAPHTSKTLYSTGGCSWGQDIQRKNK